MKSTPRFLAPSLLLATLLGMSAFGQTTIISDNYNVTTSGTGFALGAGVNTGITPPTTRLTGTAAPNLRYYQTATAKLAASYDINSNRLRVGTDSGIGRFVLSANGSTAFDFGPALGAPYASPSNQATYDITITMRNNASGTARFSFALATVEGDTGAWDFGLQLYRATGSDDFYTVQKRIDANSSGFGTDWNAVMATTASGTWVASGQSNINFLIRVTDAGAETGANYNSRIQVSTNAGASWIYDTSTDSGLTNGFRFDAAARIIIFDQAANTSGAVFYDNFSIVSTYAPAPPPDRVWNGGGTDDNWSTADNWSGVAVANGSPLIFAGGTRPANVNDIAGLVVPSLTFNNGGFSLSGNSVTNTVALTNAAGVNTLGLELAWDTTGAKTWSLASGSELVLNNLNTIEVNGDQNIYGGGTLRLKNAMNIGVATTANPPVNLNEGQLIIDGGTLTTRGGYRIGSLVSGAAAQTIVTNGGALAITASAGNLRVGDSANPLGARFDINNGTVSLTGSAIFAVAYATGATGTVSQTGGLVSVPIVSFSESGAGSGAYTIKNGTLSTRWIRKNNASGLGAVYFDNAILNTAAGASNANFFAGLTTAQIDAGGLAVDAVSDVTIGQNLSGPGALVKSNFATLTLSGDNTYVGNTLVLAGKLANTTGRTNTANIIVADGAEVGVTVASPGTTYQASNLNFSGVSFGTMSFDLGNFSTPTAPLLRVTSLSVAGPVTINIANGLQLNTGTITLVKYSGAISGGFQFSLGSLPSGMTANLVNNSANSSIDLNITGVPGLRWTGATDNNWDNSTLNWLDKQSSSAAAYSDGYPIEFLDGAANPNINVSAFPTPTTISVSNNSLAYIWTGGAITVPLLKKSGTSSLTRVETAADAITGIEINGGSFIASNTFDGAFTTVLSDTTPNGTFVKSGLSTMTLSASSPTYDGAILIQEGTLKVSNANALGTTNGGTTIASGATLDLNDQVFSHEPVTVSGSGDAGIGAIIDTTTGTSVMHNLTDVTLAGDTTLGCPNGGRWDIRVRSSSGPDTGLKGNGYNLTKVGSGQVSIACARNLGAGVPYWNMNLGDVTINAGILAFAESLTLGNPAKALTVNSDATLQLFDLNVTNPIVRNITLNSARIISGGGDTDTNVVNGTIATTGANWFNLDQGAFIVNGAITGSGSLNISGNGPGRVYLNGTSTYAGVTTVTNGTIGGTGVIPGNLVMLGGTNAPGMSLGTLTVNGSATLAGTTFMEIDRGAAPNSDRLSVGGALNFGGILQVVLGAGAATPQGGDVYQLFNKGGSGSFTTIALPALAGGLTWNTANLTVNGTLSVLGESPRPAITNVFLNGDKVLFSGTGGTAGNTYVVVSATSAVLPAASWTPVLTNVFGAGGTFSVTNTIDPAKPVNFFRLRVPTP